LTKKNENDIAETFKGYSTFIEVENHTLRNFNQWTAISNIRELGLLPLVGEYLAKLTAKDQLGVFAMAEYIRQKGIVEVRRELIKEGVFA
jgi:hypothetical protein